MNEAKATFRQQHSLSGSLSMQLCYRNDAASDNDDEEQNDFGAPQLGGRCLSASSNAGANCGWQKFKRPPKSLPICPLGSLAHRQLPTAEHEHKTKLHNRRPLEPELLAACSALNDLLLSDDRRANSGDQGALGSSGGIDHSGMLARRSEEIASQQARLKAEAEFAMAQAEPMARMQLQVERHSLPRSSPTIRQDLSCLSIEELKRIEADLLDRIKDLNEELMHCLIERDSQLMEQDSMLVEVKDLTRRARELVERLTRKNPTELAHHY